MVTKTNAAESREKRNAIIFGVLALFLISFAAMTSYFSYDEIGALAPKLKAERGFTSTDVMSLYTAYSISVILFVVWGGVLADKLGVRKSAIIFALLFAVGTLMVNLHSYTAMWIGRFVFGLGCEAYYVVMQKIIAKWFKGKMLATAFGINLLLSRLGTLACFNLLPWMAGKTTISTTFWIVTGITFIGVLGSAAYWFLDIYGEKKKYVSIQEDSQSSDDFKIKDVFKLPKAFWAISILCVVYYSAIFPFTALSTDFFVENYKLTNQAAGRLTGVIVFISMVSTWAFGALIDVIGKRATIMIIGSLAMIPCHISMGYTNIPPIIPMVVLGLSFSLVPAALWPSVPLMVKDNQLGTAYGVISMVQNIGLALFPFLAGRIRDITGSYKPTMIMFSSLGVLGVIFAVWLKILERKGGGYLEKK